MALIHLMTTSKYLQMDVDINIYKPNQINKKEPLYLMYLLHGFMGNYSNWTRYTRLEKYLEGKNVIVVMPSGYNSWYVNSLSHVPFDSYINKELHKIVKETLNLNFKRENTFIAGLSMGGYGAMRSILTYPKLYSKGASLSGVLDVENRYEHLRNGFLGSKNVFPKTISKKQNLFSLLKQDMDIDLYVSCGDKDVLLSDSINFKEELIKNNIKHHFEIAPGEHNWDFWDSQIKKVIEYFGI